MNRVDLAVSSYRVIRDRIIAVEESIDEQTLSDTLEGLTDFHEIVAAVVRAALLDEALVSGLKQHIEVLRHRLQRLTERAIQRREIARHAMIEVDLKKVAAPDFTLSIRAGSPALVVVDEAAIPQAYWEVREPRLNRLDLVADLKRGAAIPGASLSNPEPVLSVRVR